MIVEVNDLEADPDDPTRTIARGWVDEGHVLERVTLGTVLIVAARAVWSAYGCVIDRATVTVPEEEAGTIDEITVLVDMSTWRQAEDHR